MRVLYTTAREVLRIQAQVFVRARRRGREFRQIAQELDVQLVVQRTEVDGLDHRRHGRLRPRRAFDASSPLFSRMLRKELGL